MNVSPILSIITSSEEVEQTNSIVRSLGYQEAVIIEGTPNAACEYMRSERYSPKYIILFIGNRESDIIPELDYLAEQCESDTRVVVIGHTNDINFYRTLKERGVVEYFNYPPPVDKIRQALFVRHGSDSKINGKIVSVIGGSAGDGSSMVALNSAYVLASKYKKKTVLVDLDYQFGMVSRQLELQPNYGIKEIFDHPERGVDATLIERMVVSYREGLDVIAAPQTLHFMPTVKPETIRDFLTLLAEQYEYVIVDVPHIWSHWVSATVGTSDQLVLVAQLLLKSVTHSSRLIRTWTESGFMEKTLTVAINRSGSRFKEAIHPKDFERICDKHIDIYLPNDIKTITQSENKGVPVYDIGKSQLANELDRIAQSMMSTNNSEDN